MKNIDFAPKSIAHFSNPSHERRSNLNLNMFVEDLYGGVIPIQANSIDSFSAKIIGSNEEKVKIMLNSFNRHTEHNNSQLICDVVQQIAQKLAWNGEAAYEIMSYRKEDKINYYLHNFTTRRLFQIPKYYIQAIPISDYDKWGKFLNILPSDIVWYISMPSQFGGVKEYKKYLKKLKKFKELNPQFLKDNLYKKGSYFNINKYKEEFKIYVEKLFKKIGWNKRDWSSEYKTEFYVVLREVRFSWYQTILREYIIDSLNELIENLNLDCEISVSGLPTSSDILKTKKDLIKGEMKLTEVVDYLMQF
ncbi:hypothetical protein [Sporohalobacter salinus]|uniref:hypothetical protein n=1 Tax=Sporohalobacter salinus TaxID=1494606 RepID=UPI00195F8DCF|nr:hypothetical protein [Sporohalobacter salinus]MBM7624271.1 hypothetical protein [Sporohalobacter salinus]